MKRIAMLAALTLVLTPGFVRAQEAVRSWPGLNAAALSKVYVTDDEGVETAGRFLRLDADSLTLLVDGVEQRFDAARVRRIERRGDSLRNGALIGAVVGAAMGLASAGLSDCPGAHPGGSCPGARTGIFLVSTGVYSAVGTAIDALVVGRTTVYVARRAEASAAHGRSTAAASGARAGVSLRFAW